MRIVDADALYKQLKHFGLENGSSLGRHSGIAEDFLHAIASAPTIDPENLRLLSEWIEVDDGVLIGDGKHLECKNCGIWKKDSQRSNFCPVCGAKMKTHN